MLQFEDRIAAHSRRRVYMRARSKSAPTDKTNMTRLLRVAELLVAVTAFVGLQLWLIYRTWRRHDASAH
jgi:hypothetical protein